MKNYVYDLLYTLPLAIITTYFLTFFMGDSNGIVLYVMAFVMMTVITAVKHLGFRNRIYLAGGILAFILIRILVIEKDNRKEYLMKSRYVIVFLLLMLLIYVIGLVAKENAIIRKGIFLILIAVICYIIFKGISISNIVRLTFFAYFITVFIEEIQSGWKKSGYYAKSDHMVGAVPFILAICIVAGLLPASDKPYNWSVCKNIWERIVFAANEFSGHWYRNDEYDGVGFSDMCELGLDIANDSHKKDAFEITGSRAGNDVVYLSGIIFDTFDGRKWSITNKKTEYPRLFDILETRAAVRSFDPEYIDDYICISRLDMNYKLHNTKYVFVPAKAMILDKNIEGKPYFETEEKVTTKKALRYGDQYSLSYIGLNRENDIFNRFMNSRKTIDGDTWENERELLHVDKDQNYSFEELTKYHEYIKNTYTQKITISEELRDELDRIYDGALSDYEKMQRLETYFRQFKYTLSPGKIPSEINTPSEFLDYFLLEKKEGYCVYYATAFTLLARAEGLPSRYAQGYRAGNVKGKTVNVTLGAAHAWPEVYFEGKGWIGFEPTPGYHSGQKWNVSERTSNEVKSSYMGEIKEQESEPPVEMDTADNADKSNWNVGSLVLALLAGVIFLVVYILIARIVVIYKNRNCSVHEQTLYACKRNLKLLGVLKFRMKQGETLEEFAYRIKNKTESIDISFIDCYEDMIYGNVTADEKILECVMKSQKSIETTVCEKKRIYRIIKIFIT